MFIVSACFANLTVSSTVMLHVSIFNIWCRIVVKFDVFNLQESSCVRQLSSISSQDSGFVSHDVPLSDIGHSQDVSSLSQLMV